jgi:NAD(P)-dependent dehydrogenase (short-subunit alcohol dehydrogenase family)
MHDNTIITNQVAIVFGGAGALGSEVVARLTRRGLFVYVIDINDFKKEDSVDFIRTDVRKSEQLDDAIKYILNSKSSRKITTIISLAGGAINNEFLGLAGGEDQLFIDSIHLNLTSHILIAKRAQTVLHDCSDNKSLTFVSSINALKSYGLPAYSAAKAGLVGLVRSTMVELGRNSIRVNAILLGTFLTLRTSKQPKDFAALAQGTALGRITTANEVAHCVEFIALDATSITGQDIVVDCGQTIKACM